LPPPDAWEIQERDCLRPSAKWLSAVISRAIESKAGLLFVHSHPRAEHPAGFSGVDRESLEALGETIAPMLDGPFAAAVVHESSWAGALWEDGIGPIQRIVSVGSGYRSLSAIPVEQDTPLDARQRDALGIVHHRVRGLAVGLVGCGGLMRMGTASVVIVDSDVLDTDSNVRRVFGSSAADLRATTPPAKVDVVGRHLDQLQLGTSVERVRGDVRVETIFRTLLDCDVVLCGTDTHGSRAIVNELPYAHLLPVIDVGVRVGSRGASLNGLLVPSVAGLTVLGAGMAICALLAFLSDDGNVIPSGYWFDGMFGDARETQPNEPRADCRCRQQFTLADAALVPFIAG